MARGRAATMQHAALAQEPSRLLTCDDPAPVIQFGTSVMEGALPPPACPSCWSATMRAAPFPRHWGHRGQRAGPRAPYRL
ncbi:hypothetical protein RAA17_10000 [Komagataeibacter rhaeticus]|nr:hypothetical protein [Komagataeibacter rhaeticus]